MEAKTNLGALQINVKGKAKDGQAEAIAALCAASLIWRAGGSKLFGEKSGHKRDEAFGSKLAADGKAAAEAVLAPYFDDVVVEVSEKPASKPSAQLSKAHDVMKGLPGITEADLRRAFPALYPAEKQAEAEPELAVG